MLLAILIGYMHASAYILHTLHYTCIAIPLCMLAYKHTSHLNTKLTIIILYAHTHAHVQSLQSLHNYACTLQLVLFISSRLSGIAQNNFKAELVVSILPNLYTTKSNMHKLLSVYCNSHQRTMLLAVHCSKYWKILLWITMMHPTHKCKMTTSVR